MTADDQETTLAGMLAERVRMHFGRERADADQEQIDKTARMLTRVTAMRATVYEPIDVSEVAGTGNVSRD